MKKFTAFATMAVTCCFSQGFAAQAVLCKVNGAAVNVFGTQVSVNGQK